MPAYDMCCSKCKETIEIFKDMSADFPKRHKNCGGKLTRIFSLSYTTKTTFETVGSLADKAASKMTDAEKKAKQEAQKTKQDSDLPGYNPKHPFWKNYRKYEA